MPPPASMPPPATGSTMPRLPPRPLFAPALSLVSATAPAPASGSTMPRLPPQPLFPPLPASAPPPPRQGRPCRGSCRGPFARFVPRHRPRPRVRVGYAAAPAAAPVPAVPASLPPPPRQGRLCRGSCRGPCSRPLCPVGGGKAAVIPQASLPSRPLAPGLPLPPVPHFF